ncbi:DUF2480 family protein [Cytophagaceae bacterium YF14B1]|uniref:DUF2480 family protein n=1 Tax=Xanthocytophaga flava TaxID=3048013 RepID=A0AAE3QS10_9BACT|nr:DUF2480 family protein [Xanthocytophaga flavus]MDJ1482450.1 DUF2480 family protein [Xanthocytophaga flavus]
MEAEIINRVASSGLLTLDLADYYHPGERVVYDLKDNLFQGLILKEKDFRQFLKEHDWSNYAGKNVAVLCSEDAIVPVWAYMLLTTYLEPYVNKVVFGDLQNLEQALFQDALSKISLENYINAKVVVKGCGDLPIPSYAYVEITRLLRPVAQSIMYGEPCSTVPIYKKPKNS